jgi:N-glycosylase/DNA lyase
MVPEELKKSYASRKNAIRKRLAEFEEQKSEEQLLQELVFCLLTPQSKAKGCWKSVESLTERGFLYTGSEKEIKSSLVCRFPNNKARYVIETREKFPEIRTAINSLKDQPQELRLWLVKNVKGYGMKEASHFMRNIGLGQEIAILDRHILKNLQKFGAIPEIPKTLAPKKYMEIEDSMKSFSEKIEIPMDELDLLFWSEEAGEVFK